MADEHRRAETSPRLGDLLVQDGVAPRATVERAAVSAREHHRSIGAELVQVEGVEEADTYRALARQRGVRFSSPEELLVVADHDVVHAVPRSFLERHRLLPIARAGGSLLVATADPDAPVDDMAKAFGGLAPVVHLVTPTDYRRLWIALDLATSRDSAPPPEPVVTVHAPAAGSRDLLLHDAASLEARFVALFDAMLLEAIGQRASDIHLERYGDVVRVRLRVDGDLRDAERLHLTPAELAGVLNVIKVEAGLDIAERRLPQGGRARRHAGAHAYDLRVQTQPALHGEHAVVRLLPQDAKLLTIEDLGFPPDAARTYRRLLDSPNGLVLVVGPTGSGKSTTLYAGLQILARDATRKVLTIEDPIEYAIDGVQQTQVHAEIGLGFANAMRAFVREDPDVILVGEIRDGETALEAIRASQTGHVVLSTLHCNDAPDAVQRLVDLGMHPNSIASELLAVIAQRLGKRVCDGCRVACEPDAAIAADVFPRGIPSGFRTFRGAGCARCAGHGTHGRVAVIELLRASAEVRAAIAHRTSLDDLRAVARGAGLVSLRTSALDLALRGVIPFTELPSLLAWERMAEEPS